MPTFSVWFGAPFHQPDGILCELTAWLNKLSNLIHFLLENRENLVITSQTPQNHCNSINDVLLFALPEFFTARVTMFHNTRFGKTSVASSSCCSRQRWLLFERKTNGILGRRQRPRSPARWQRGGDVLWLQLRRRV